MPSRLCSLKVTEFMPQRKLLGGAAATQKQQQQQGRKQGTKQRKGPELTGAATPQQKAEPKLKASAVLGVSIEYEVLGQCCGSHLRQSGHFTQAVANSQCWWVSYAHADSG